MLVALHAGLVPAPSRDLRTLAPSDRTVTSETDCTADGDCESSSDYASSFSRRNSSIFNRWARAVNVQEFPTSKQNGDRRAAWLHIPKCGSSLAVSLGHYLNPELPSNASIEGELLAQYPDDAQEVAFCRKYPLPWGQEAIWEKNGNWGNHFAIRPEEYAEFKGTFMGLFREPARRIYSAYNYFEMGQHNESNITPAAEYAQRNAGGMTKMLAGQDFGLHCLQHGLPCDESIVPDEELATQRLKESFAFVGVTDDYAFSICLFKALFGGECHAAEFGNARPTGYSDEPDDYRVALGVNEAYDPVDTRIFQAAQARYCADIASVGLTHGKCRESICPAAAEHFAGADDEGGAGCSISTGSGDAGSGDIP